MILINYGHDYVYEIQSIVDIFLPGVKIAHRDDLDENCKEDYLITKIISKPNTTSCDLEVILQFDGKIYNDKSKTGTSDKEEVEYAFALMIYNIMRGITGIVPKWGLLTGIRPVKLAQKKIALGWSDKKITDYYINDILLDKSRAKLMLDTAKQSRPAFDKLSKNSFSLYVSIPFCPSRCSYCSFVSHSIERTAKLVPDYLDRLCEEIAFTAKKTSDAGMILTCIYVGGGTPTSLDAEDLGRVLECIGDSFDLSNLLEYTVEAGRADTITREKLAVIKNSGATRISINPQTFSDDVLQSIGRKHTVEQVIDSFHLAREMGFDNINMDLIAGLNTESLGSFKHSIDSALELSPENITVHTLAVKRSSDASITGSAIYDADGGLVSDMLDYAYEKFNEFNYLPYYLYRQRNMRDNLENVGFGRDGQVCYYNIYTMEEIQTVLACGAGAVSKSYNSDTGKIKRVFNYKFPYEYLDGFDVMIERKNSMFL